MFMEGFSFFIEITNQGFILAVEEFHNDKQHLIQY